MQHLKRTRNLLWDTLRTKIQEEIVPNSPIFSDACLPNTLNISFLGYEAQSLFSVFGFDVFASLGSACHSHQRTFSPVLTAMGLSEERMRGAVRFSTGLHSVSSLCCLGQVDI